MWGRPARAHAAREPPKENRRCVRRSRERPASMMPRGAARRGAAHALARLHDPARTPHTTASVLVCMCAGRQARLTQVGSGRALRQGSQPASTMPRGAAPRTRSPARARQPAVEEMHEPYQLRLASAVVQWHLHCAPREAQRVRRTCSSAVARGRSTRGCKGVWNGARAMVARVHAHRDRRARRRTSKMSPAADGRRQHASASAMGRLRRGGGAAEVVVVPKHDPERVPDPSHAGRAVTS